jgi:hypothetical protein
MHEHSKGSMRDTKHTLRGACAMSARCRMKGNHQRNLAAIQDDVVSEDLHTAIQLGVAVVVALVLRALGRLIAGA